MHFSATLVAYVDLTVKTIVSYCTFVAVISPGNLRMYVTGLVKTNLNHATIEIQFID